VDLDTVLSRGFSRTAMDQLYSRLNRREFIHPDPLEFLYHYEAPLDQEVAGLIASSLAYGRVAQILKSVARVLTPLGPCPSGFLLRARSRSLEEMFGDFRHRFTAGAEVISLLVGIKRVLEHHGSLQKCFLGCLNGGDPTVLPALAGFVKQLNVDTGGKRSTLLPSPLGGSACKRLNLFLRWMVRRDDVDPGCWEEVSPSLLVIPLDTHMHRIGLKMGLTTRKQADIRTALEMTRVFMSVRPDDPVRYDFALTRLGIRRDLGRLHPSSSDEHEE
jgi:uncharacterized protein (TIGR02757 family)